MNEVLICGLGELPDNLKQSVVHYVMDKSNWAKKTNRKAETRVQTVQSTPAVAVPGYVRAIAPSRSSHPSNDPPTYPTATPAYTTSSGSAYTNSTSLAAHATADQHRGSTAVATLQHRERERFVIPIPGRDGAIPNSLAGQICGNQTFFSPKLYGLT